MLRCTVVSPTNEMELDDVYEFFAKSFGPDYFTAKKNFGFLRKNEPYASLDNHLIVKEVNNEVVGAFRLVDRELMLGSVRLKAGGLSYYAVHPEFWSRGIAQVIWKVVLERMDKTVDISLGFARRRLDRYYSRFGYIGYTSFALLTVDLNVIPSDSKECYMVDFCDTHLPAYQRYHLDNYQDVFGSVYRDDALWDYCLKKISWYKLGTLFSFKGQNDRLVGYALIQKDTILEIAGDRGAYLGMLKALKAKLGKATSALEFNLSPAHPFFRFLLRFNHRYTIRRVWDGGHVARTAPVPKFLERIRPVLEARLREAECSGFSLRITGQAFEWTGLGLRIRSSRTSEPNDVEFDVQEWQKILLGVVLPSDANGFRTVSKRAERIAHTLFPVLWPQTPELDQF